MNAESEYSFSLIEKLRRLSNETEWLEFKVDNN